MTKAEVKTICEADDKLQWWAMVLFAELSDIEHHHLEWDSAVVTVVKSKIKEFRGLVIQRAFEKADEQLKGGAS